MPCSGMFRNVPGCSGMFHVPGFIDARKLRTVGDKSQNSFATESTLNFSGPYRRVRPAKLTNHSARTNEEI